MISASLFFQRLRRVAREPLSNLMGDNRVQSFDSRAIGPVPMEKVRGRAWVIYWPIDHLRLLR